MEIVARRRIRKGEEVSVSFGPRSNDNLLLYYGEEGGVRREEKCSVFSMCLWLCFWRNQMVHVSV